jgi:hypothetical protein
LEYSIILGLSMLTTHITSLGIIPYFEQKSRKNAVFWQKMRIPAKNQYCVVRVA